MNIKRAAIAVGHTPSGVAGCGAVGYVDESNCTREICPIIVDILEREGIETKLIRIDKANSYEFEDCYERARIANEWGADIYIEIHLNSFNSNAYGTETYVISESTTAVEVAKRINKSIVSALGTVDRTNGKGFKTNNYIVLRETNMPAILVETLFCDNKSDCEKYNADTIGKAIAEAVIGREILVGSTSEVKPAENRPTGNDWIAKLQAECNRQGFSNQTVDGFAGPNTLAGCPMVRYGARGNITKLIQERLISLGYDVSCGADGIFGNGTKQAVMQFQRDSGLSSDGIVGRNTWRVLLGL